MRVWLAQIACMHRYLGLIVAAFAPVSIAVSASLPSASLQQSARFELCASGPRVTCVVDGDTFWLDGAKIRIADINTPETSQPSCAAEAQLGKRATRRLMDLLNEGPFVLEVRGREVDRYGRMLRLVIRNGQSLGAILEAEGLAEHWNGHRRNWCAAA